MSAEFESLTLPEAAVIAGVTLRDVNRVIDEKILPERFYTLKGRRRVRAAACPLIGFYVRAADALTAEERSILIRRLSDRIGGELLRKPVTGWSENWRPADWIVEDRFLTVSFWEFATDTQERHAKLSEARKTVVEDPEILGGTPVIRGTRIPVHDIAAAVAAGQSPERIRSAYPALDDRIIKLATTYAEATPRRGRPRRAVIPPGSAILSETTMARRPHEASD